MVFNNFRANVTIRVILICLSTFLLFYLSEIQELVVSAVLAGLMVILQTWLLIRYVEQTNQKLTSFLRSIKYSDFSTSFSSRGIGRTWDQLAIAFNEVINEFKKHRNAREESYNYLQTVVQHVNVGIITFHPDGKITQFNNAVQRMLRLSNIHSIQDLKIIHSDLPERLLQMKAGDKALFKLFMGDEVLQLSIHSTEFKLKGEDLILISIQDIHPELEDKEIESWQKLIRVLTHEIMNSITPISSLAGTVKEMLITDDDQKELNTLEDDDIESVISALNTIEKRSQGLLNFVETYRNLTRIPKPNFRYFPVEQLFSHTLELLKPRIDEAKIRCSCQVIPDNLMLTADPDLIEQVIINLAINAIDAVKAREDPRIGMIAFLDESGRLRMEMTDNGYGITPDILDKIFMPFFTSKKHGSGIGLSLSRQIMHLHKGSISVKSKPDEGSVFILTF